MRDHPDMIIIRMTAILVSRFLLDLQAASQKSLKLARDDPLYSSRMGDSEDNGRGVGSLEFAGFDVVGSLGASLNPSEHASDRVEDAEIIEDDLEEKRGQSTGVDPEQPALEGSTPAAGVKELGAHSV